MPLKWLSEPVKYFFFYFRQFCEAHKKEYYQYNEFLDAVETYEIELEEARAKSAAIVFKKYLTRPDTSDSGVDTCENEVIIFSKREGQKSFKKFCWFFFLKLTEFS